MVGGSSSTVMLVLTLQVGEVTMNKLIDVPGIIVNLVLRHGKWIDLPVNGISRYTTSEAETCWAVVIFINIRRQKKNPLTPTYRCCGSGHESVKRWQGWLHNLLGVIKTLISNDISVIRTARLPHSWGVVNATIRIVQYVRSHGVASEWQKEVMNKNQGLKVLEGWRNWCFVGIFIHYSRRQRVGTKESRVFNNSLSEVYPRYVIPN